MVVDMFRELIEVPPCYLKYVDQQLRIIQSRINLVCERLDETGVETKALSRSSILRMCADNLNVARRVFEELASTVERVEEVYNQVSYDDPDSIFEDKESVVKTSQRNARLA